MTQIVRVICCNEDATAEVIHVRQSACSGDCHQCAGCGAAQESLRLKASNPIGPRPGDMVIIESRSGPVLAAAAVLYILPLLLFFAGYLVGEIWDKGPLTAGLSFCGGIAGAIAYDRLVLRRKTEIYTITGYAPGETAGI